MAAENEKIGLGAYGHGLRYTENSILKAAHSATCVGLPYL